MEHFKKIVDFKKYCETCKHKDVDEVKDPCNECLENPVNDNSHKPVCYKEDSKNEKRI